MKAFKYLKVKDVAFSSIIGEISEIKKTSDDTSGLGLETWLVILVPMFHILLLSMVQLTVHNGFAFSKEKSVGGNDNMTMSQSCNPS